MSFKIYKPEDVVSAESFAGYAQQQLGIPYPTLKQMIILKRQIKDVMEKNPGFTYASLPRVVEWAKSRKKRFADPIKLLSSFRYAFEDGYLPELSERYEDLIEIDDKINAALRVETDQEWRRALMLSEDIEEKNAMYTKWVELRSHLFTQPANK